MHFICYYVSHLHRAICQILLFCTAFLYSILEFVFFLSANERMMCTAALTKWMGYQPLWCSLKSIMISRPSYCAYLFRVKCTCNIRWSVSYDLCVLSRILYCTVWQYHNMYMSWRALWGIKWLYYKMAKCWIMSVKPTDWQTGALI